jgi:hypothetical protein
MGQLELFAQPALTVSTVPSVESVRARLEAILAPLRTASEPRWSAKETARWKLVVPQMADWLPPDERDAVRAEFARLIQRL